MNENDKNKLAKLDRKNRLRAIAIYCDGVKSDFPETGIWMDNILSLAKEEPQCKR